jgi:hypothetical protein
MGRRNLVSVRPTYLAFLHKFATDGDGRSSACVTELTTLFTTSRNTARARGTPNWNYRSSATSFFLRLTLLHTESINKGVGILNGDDESTLTGELKLESVATASYK